MPTAEEPIENLAEALQRAYPELDAVRAAATRAGLPGRRRRARPPARPRARRPRPRRRGRRRGACRPPRRRRRLARALRDREGAPRRPRGRRRHRPHRDLPAARRPARGRAGRRSRPTSPAATSRSTRWRSRSRRGRRLIDPHGGARRPRGRPAARPAPAAPSPTTRPGRCAPPATPPASASRSSRRPRTLLREAPTSARSPPTGARPSCCASPAKPSAPRGVRAARRSGAWSSCAPAASRAGGRVGERCSPGGSPWRELGGPRSRLCSRPRLGPVGRGGGARRLRARRGPPRRSPWPPATTRSSSCSPARWAPSGSTATSAEWRDVGLEIDGDDLIAAGVPQGPALGRGLDAALRRKLDGEIARARGRSWRWRWRRRGSGDGVA